MPGRGTEFAVDGMWLGADTGPIAVRLKDGRVQPAPDLGPGDLPRHPVTILPGVVDRHVHLGLVDAQRLAGSTVVEVHDLGWIPEVATGWREQPPAGVRVRVAGAFHTAPGGYPSGREWAPEAAVREVADTTEAAMAVEDAVTQGVDALKIALHAGMSLLCEDVLRALVGGAHDAGLPAVVHAEGPGQTARAIDAGADVLVHAPWSETVPDAVLRRGRHMTWLSTLAIHDDAARECASDNIRRFRAVGGTVFYGTDMGNGPTPVGPSAEEIRALEAAGLAGDELVTAVAGPTSTSIRLERALVSPHPVPRTADELVTWLEDAHRLDPARVEETV